MELSVTCDKGGSGAKSASGVGFGRGSPLGSPAHVGKTV